MAEDWDAGLDNDRGRWQSHDHRVDPGRAGNHAAWRHEHREIAADIAGRAALAMVREAVDVGEARRKKMTLDFACGFEVQISASVLHINFSSYLF